MIKETTRMRTRDVAIPLHLLLDHTTYHVRLAYRAASTLWPERTRLAQTLDPRDAGVLRKWTNGDWQQLVGVDDEADGMPNWLHAKMRRLYPLFHDARTADGALLIRLCLDEAATHAERSGSSRPLSAGEIESSWAHGLRENLLERYRVTPRELRECVGRQSDEWRAADADGWFGARARRHRGVSRRFFATRRAELHILSREPADDVWRLLAAAGVPAEPAMLSTCGAPDAARLADTLHTVCARTEAGSELVWVDDRVDELRAAASDARLLSLSLALASWGSATPEGSAALLSSVPRTRLLSDSRQLEPLLACAPFEGLRRYESIES